MEHQIKKLFRFVLPVLFVLVPSLVHACDLCGAFIGVLPNDNRSSIGLQHRYLIFSGYPGLAQQGQIFPSGAYRLAATHPSVLHGGSNATAHRSPGDFESYKVFELRGKWFVFPRVEIDCIIPFNENRSSNNGTKTKLDGIGDATFFAGYHLLQKTGEDKKFRHILVAGFGIKVPTGNCSAQPTDNLRLPVEMQLGTGSIDEIFYLAYTGGGMNFRWGTTLSGKINGTNKFGEQLSSSTANTFFFGYDLHAGKWNFMPQVQVYQEYMKGVWDHNALQTGTGMNVVMAGPSVDVFFTNFHFSTGIQLPVQEQTETYNLLTKARLFVGITYSFNQSHFLFQNKKS